MLNTSLFSVLVHEQAARYGDATVLSYRDYERNEWLPVSWNEFSAVVRRVSAALLSLGVEMQENLAVFSQNKPECLYVDFGAYGIRAVTIPFYATSSESQVTYMVNDAQVRYVFVGEQYQYDTAFRCMPHCPSLQKLVIFDRTVVKNPQDKISVYFDEFLQTGDDSLGEEIDRRSAALCLDDLANILYTSGTTGTSKGVMLTHRMYHDALIANDKVLPLSEKDVVLNFLPLTHVFERAWTYLCIHRGAEVCVNLRPHDVQASMREVHPTAMCSVPRFWEKVYVAVHEQMAQSSGLRRKLMEDALKVGRLHNIDYVRRELTPPVWLRLKYKFYEKTVYTLLKKTIGLENANFFPTAGAAVSDTICEFAHSVGIFMLVGYGLTESTATVSCFRKQGFEVGSVGQVMPGLEVKIGENNEILLRGRTITVGYYKKPVSTADAIDKEGWFHTGDAGYLKGDHLYLTERIKDLFKTSNGKYISPQALETHLILDRYIDQAAVIADQRKFVSALIVPTYDLVKKLL